MAIFLFSVRNGSLLSDNMIHFNVFTVTIRATKKNKQDIK